MGGLNPENPSKYAHVLMEILGILMDRRPVTKIFIVKTEPKKQKLCTQELGYVLSRYQTKIRQTLVHLHSISLSDTETHFKNIH